MVRRSRIDHEFVDEIPATLAEGVLYISVGYETAAHKCLCGCGSTIVTPLSPTDWRLIFDGETVSLSPSIGNWSFPCRSHYWIRNNRISWAKGMSRKRIALGREADRREKERRFRS